MKLLLFPFFLAFLQCFSVESSVDPKSIAIDLYVEVALSQSTLIDVFDKDIKNFVHQLTNSFTFPEQTTSPTQFMRFAIDLITQRNVSCGSGGGGYGYDFYTRNASRVNAIIDEVLTYATYPYEIDAAPCISSMENLAWVRAISSGNDDNTPFGSVTANRVAVLVMDSATEYVDIELQRVLSVTPLLFAVGVPGKNGNLVAQHRQAVVDGVGGNPKRVFNTIADALDPQTGILAQVGAELHGLPLCSGFVFPMDATSGTKRSQPLFTNIVDDLVQHLPGGANGFSFNWDPFGYKAQTEIAIQFWKRWTGPLESHNQAAVVPMLQFTLQMLQTKQYVDNGIFLLMSPDDSVNVTVALDLAAQINAFNVPVYVFESTIWSDSDETVINALTRNQRNRRITYDANLSEACFISIARATILKEFSNLGCAPLTNPPPPPPTYTLGDLDGCPRKPTGSVTSWTTTPHASSSRSSSSRTSVTSRSSSSRTSVTSRSSSSRTSVTSLKPSTSPAVTTARKSPPNHAVGTKLTWTIAAFAFSLSLVFFKSL